MSRTILSALACSAALLLSACGTGTSSPESTRASTSGGSGAFPVTVEHAMGATTVEEEPTRIVALDSSYADTTLLLEEELVGITTYRGYSTDLPDYLGDARDEYADQVESVGELEAPSLEKIAALEPDLIAQRQDPARSPLRPAVLDRTDDHE